MSKLDDFGKEALSLDDVLLRPHLSDLDSRNDARLDTIVAGYNLRIPIISSPMSTVTESEMALAMSKLGGFGIIHRFPTPEEQAEEVKKISDRNIRAAAVNTDRYRIDKLVEAGANILSIDIAHGYSKNCFDTIKYIKKKYPEVKIMCGNIATEGAARDSIKAGADILRVGLGGGSVCTTRIKAGVGIPNATALDDVVDYVDNEKYHNRLKKEVSIVLDGGIKDSGDIVKALALGADGVILGFLIAGTTETPGPILKEGNMKYKMYSGMASRNEQIRYKGELSKDIYEEGIEVRVPFRGPVRETIKDLCQAVKSGFAYCGARNIGQLRSNASFVKITLAGLYESYAHALFKK